VLLDAEVVRRTLVTFRDTVRAHAPGLNRLNVYPVPDGDTGTNMARTLDAVVEAMEQAPPALEPTLAAISHGSLMGARGNSGVILSQILRGWSSTLSKVATTGGAGAVAVAEALSAASVAAYQAVLKPIEGTILTVVREASEAARAAADAGADLVGVLQAARDEGRASLARTPELLPVLRDAGVVDAGAAGFLLFLDAALFVLTGDPLPTPEEAEGDGPTIEQLEAVALRHREDGVVDVSELRYEVMYFLDLDDALIEDFKQGWGEIGDSIVVVGGDGLWNCHVHTNDIGAAIEVPLGLGGRPRQIRVTDLFEEVAEEHAHREAAMTAGTPPPGPGAGLPEVTCAVVAVCSGDGLAELFAALGVQGVVTGGQTLNPSTAELLDAVAHVNANQVIILPNNKNIVPVAQQVDGLSPKHVRVVPTCSMPEALAALVVYDPEAGADENAATMQHAIDTVATGEVTQAVRASNSEAGPVAEGDWIGLVRGDGIVAVATELLPACTALLDHLVHPGHEIVTVIEGDGATPEVTTAIVAWLGEHRPATNVEVHAGGQPLYPYLFGAE
jgi:DAK2 domain fusion protein YloV